jgi:hypothetical protein
MSENSQQHVPPDQGWLYLTGSGEDVQQHGPFDVETMKGTLCLLTFLFDSHGAHYQASMRDVAMSFLSSCVYWSSSKRCTTCGQNDACRIFRF